MKHHFLIALIIFLCIYGFLLAETVGANFPLFSFESHDGTLINNKTIQDMDIKIIIYGNPDALSNNRKQLDLVLEWLKSNNKTSQLLYTINFSSYPRLIRGIIKNQIQKNSQEFGINIYADWDAVFNKHFKLDTTKVTFFLLNDGGLIYESFSFLDATNTLSKISENSLK